VYHVGAQPMNLLNCTWIFATGMILGVIFQRTRNIWIPIALHTAIDVAYALVPALGWISWSTAFLCNVAIMCAVLAWWAITTTEDRRR